MADITVTAKNVSPLPDALRRDGIAAGSGNVGDSVYMTASGLVQSDGSASGTAVSKGIVVAAGSSGSLTFASGDTLTVVTRGPVAGFSGATQGGTAYVSDNAGKVADAAGTNSATVGYFWSATVLMVEG